MKFAIFSTDCKLGTNTKCGPHHTYPYSCFTRSEKSFCYVSDARVECGPCPETIGSAVTMTMTFVGSLAHNGTADTKNSTTEVSTGKLSSMVEKTTTEASSSIKSIKVFSTTATTGQSVKIETTATEIENKGEKLTSDSITKANFYPSEVTIKTSFVGKIVKSTTDEGLKKGVEIIYILNEIVNKYSGKSAINVEPKIIQLKLICLIKQQVLK